MRETLFVQAEMGTIGTPWLGRGGEAPLPSITCTPSLVTPAIVRNIQPGPGGYTRLFGGVRKESVVRFENTSAFMKTRRSLE